MKLILSTKISEYEFVNIVILDSYIYEIDKFTTSFSSRDELYNKIISKEESEEYNISKFNIYIKTQKGNILPVLYHDYSFITDDLMRRNASITIMKADPNRVYEYIENNYYNYYNYLFKKLPENADQRYKFDPIYGLSKLLLEKNNKADGEYYNYFKKNIEKNYKVLRNMIKNILTDEEKIKLGYNNSISREKKDYICTKANLNLKKKINEKIEKNRDRKYSLCSEEDDIDE